MAVHLVESLFERIKIISDRCVFPAKLSSRPLPFLAFLIVILVTLAIYSQVYQFDFVYYDDHLYVIDNTHLHSGFSLKSVAWAMAADEAGFRHPLTWLSLLLDYELYGLNPGGYHGTNLLLHIGNTFLLFVVLWKMTGAGWRSCLVAALFALHPLHVEPVAWIASRKDVLSTFFWMLTLGMYSSYVKKPDLRRYILVSVFFTFGLMSKPMLVTLPFVLLLLDYWPFQRFTALGKGQKAQTASNSLWGSSSVLRLFLEKAPWIALSGMTSIVTVLAEDKIGALKTLAMYPWDMRISNALFSYMTYMGKTLWPVHLTVYYPYPSSYLLWQIILSLFVLVAISGLAVLGRKRFPYFTVGWFWFLGTLIPVIGLVQIGSHAMADRYTYVPLIGLFIAFAWGLSEIADKLKWNKFFCGFATAAMVLALVPVSWVQIRSWQNAASLFRHNVEVTQNNSIGHNNLGAALAREGRSAEAVYHYRQALAIKPDYAESYFNMGLVLMNLERYQEAIGWYEQALRFNPRFAEVYNNQGIAYAQSGEISRALTCFQTALQIKPGYVDALRNLQTTRHRQKTSK